MGSACHCSAVVVFIAALLCLPVLSHGDTIFFPETVFPGIDHPLDVVATDLNDDTILDLAFCANAETGSGGTSKVLVYEGLGDGTFAPYLAIDIPLDFPWTIGAADFDEDGNVDLMVTDFFNPDFVVLHGDGSLAFTIESHTIPNSTGVGMADLKVVDYNEDGSMDFLLPNYAGSGVYAMEGDGSGSFEIGDMLAVNAGPYAVDSADFDGDGDLDVVVASTSTDLNLFFNDGTGEFGTATLIQNVGIGNGIGVADFNDDGNMDVCGAETEMARAFVVLLDGAGGALSIDYYPVGNLPYTVAPLDFNQDGNIDLAVNANSGNSISVFLGDGSGTLEPAQVLDMFSPSRLTAADFDGDGRIDLATSSGLGQSFSVFLNATGTDFLFVRGDGDGSTSVDPLPDAIYLLSYQFVPGSPTPPCLEAADVNGNGTFEGIVDPLHLLSFFFIPGSPPIPPPFPECGIDGGTLGCASLTCP